MFRFETVQHADMAALLRLVGEVTELPADKTIRRTHVSYFQNLWTATTG